MVSFKFRTRNSFDSHYSHIFLRTQSPWFSVHHKKFQSCKTKVFYILQPYYSHDYSHDNILSFWNNHMETYRHIIQFTTIFGVLPPDKNNIMIILTLTHRYMVTFYIFFYQIFVFIRDLSHDCVYNIFFFI